jgi:hypothetical protein
MSLSCSFALLVLGLTHSWAVAADPQLEKITSSPPEEIASDIRQALFQEGLRVVQSGEAIAEFWFRKEIPASESESAGLGVSFGRIAEGALLGVVRFPEQWYDYKNRRISSGSYTLRYAVQPADGNHMGVSVYRDFLLLIPASADSDCQALYSGEELVNLSKKASSTPHPAVLSLVPIYEEVTAPRMVKNDMDQWTIATPVGSFTLGLVFMGHGEI